MLGRVIGEDIKLKLDLAAELWPVHVDPGQLEQVLMNLALNARDAMPQGGTLSLSTANTTIDPAHARERPGLVPGDYATLTVSDTGKGIDPAVLPFVFEPFFTTKETGKGTGLGLAMVYGIVKQSDGFVYATSALNKGSVFTVLLPRMEGETTTASSHMSFEAPRGSERILLVEDDDAVRAGVRRMLLTLGYDVLDANGGIEALRAMQDAHARGVHIDLVLSDVVMPDMYGPALAERIAARWGEGMPKVMYMSGYTDDEKLRLGIVNSGALLLEKPFTPERLGRAIRAVLDRDAGHTAK
jgi:CheY-like chemotaxis protein